MASLLEYVGTNLKNVGSIINCIGDIGRIILMSYIFRNLSGVRPDNLLIEQINKHSYLKDLLGNQK